MSSGVAGFERVYAYEALRLGTLAVDWPNIVSDFSSVLVC